MLSLMLHSSPIRREIDPFADMQKELFH